MKKVQGLAKRTIGGALALIMALTLTPAQALAGAGNAGIRAGGGAKDVSKAEVSASSAEEGERIEPDPYPLDLLILEPDPEPLPEEIQEEPAENEELPQKEEEPVEEDLQAAEEEAEDLYEAAIVSGDYEYTLSSDEATITKYTGSATALELPAALDGYPVVAVGNNVFRSNKDLLSVKIPASVKTIKSAAFQYCSSLESATFVSLPALTTIDTYAFSGCTALTGFDIPETVTTIGAYAFENCSSLEGITIPAGITAIGQNTFKGCSSLTTVDVPATVTTIGSYAFRDCTSLSTVTLHDGLTKIDGNAFYADKALTAIEIPKTVTEIGSSAFYNSVKTVTFADGMVTIPNNACRGANLLETVSMPDTVTAIGTYAFYDCDNLKSVTVSSALTTIGNYAFAQCRVLAEISLPNTVTSIGEHAFYQCYLLESVNLSGITTLGNYAFDQCEALESVVLPDTLTTISEYAFAECSALKTVTLPANLTAINRNAFDRCALLEKVNLTASTKDIEFPATLTTIGYAAFSGCVLLKDIVIPTGVTEIGERAFYQCSGLEKVTFSSGLTAIGPYVFYQCSALTEANLPDTLTTIGNYAFYKCPLLTGIVLPATLTTIGTYAFYNDEKITELSVPATCTSIGSYAFYNAVKKIIFADGTVTIPANSCSSANLLEEVVIPETVTKIDSNAFYSCKKLMSVALSSELTSIGEKAFYQCELLENVTFPAKLTSIGSQAFYGCKAITAVVLPEGFKNLGNGAFYNCENLDEVKLPKTIETAGSSAFYNSAKSVVFAEGTENIPANVCDGATKLTNVTMPVGIKTIGERAFYGCTLLEEAVIPEGVTSVGSRAFYGDNALKVVIPSSLTTIGTEAFAGCTVVKACGENAKWELSEGVATIIGTGEIGNGTDSIFKDFESQVEYVEICDGITGIKDHCFDNLDNLAGIIMGKDVEDIGKEAFTGCEKLARVELSPELKTIQDKAFDGCEALDTVVFTGDFPEIKEDSLPEQKLIAYYPKTNKSYTDTTKKSISQFKWKQWDDTLPERDVVLVLDVSGSMSGDRIANLKTAVTAFVDRVGGRISNTRIAIVQYHSAATTLMPFSTDVIRMEACISKLSAGGGTEYLQGFAEAEKVLAESTAGIESIIMFSDGEPNDNRTRILEKAAEFRDNEYYMYSVGLLPSDTNRQLLINIAGSEDNYFEAEDIDALIERFLEISEGLGRGGSCGDNTRWKYNVANKELVISIDSKKSGSGKMQDFSAENPPAWDAYAGTIEKIVIGDGVTYIGAGAFSQLANVKEVHISKDVRSVGAGAFGGCTKLETVYYGGSEEDWKKVSIGDNNKPLLDATVKYNTKRAGSSDGTEKPVTKVVVKPGSISLDLGKTMTLSSTVYPKNATKKTVKWSSSDSAVATVTSTGTVKAISCGEATITATTDDGGFTDKCTVTVTNGMPIFKDFTLGGSSSGFTVDDNIPLLGGKTFSLDLPVDLPVSCVVEDGAFKVGINIAEKNLYSYNSYEGNTTTTKKKKSLKEEMEEKFKDYRNDLAKTGYIANDMEWMKNLQDEKFLKANIPGLEKAVDVTFVGYLEGQWSEKLDNIDGGVILAIKGSATVEGQWVLWFIPVTVNCEFSAEGSISGTVGYDFKNSQWYGDLGLAISLGIEPYAGIGAGQWLSVGVYGHGQTDVDIVILSAAYSNITKSITKHKEWGVQTWTISGEMGLRGYLAKKSADIKIISGDYTIYDRNGEGNGWFNEPGEAEEADVPDLFSESAEVTTLEGKESEQLYSIDADGTLVNNVYNAAKPTLIATEDEELLFYVTDDTTRSALNQSKLVYSIYNSDTGVYGEAQSVLDNGTADYEPVVCRDGDDIYVAWLDSDKVFDASEDPELIDYVNTFRVHVAKYDPRTEKFEDLRSPQAVPEEYKNYTYMPRLYVSNGTLNAAWVENIETTKKGLSDKNTIYRAEYNGTAWYTRDEIKDQSLVTSLNMGKISGAGSYSLSYVVDLDNNAVTGDRELYLKPSNRDAEKIAEGNISAISYTRLPCVNGVVLAVCKDGGMNYYKDKALISVFSGDTAAIYSDFAVVNNHIIYMTGSDGSRNLAAATYDNNKWGAAKLTHDQKYVDSFSISDGKISYLSSDVKGKGNGSFDVTSSIKMLEPIEYSDVELGYVDFAVANACPGEELPIDLHIKNNGINRLKKIHAVVSYGGTDINYSDVSVDLMPGESGAFEYSIALPADLSAGGDFTVTVTCDDDAVADNNSYALSLSKADLEVKASYDAQSELPCINVTVENRGLVDSNMEMTIEDESGKVLFTEKGLATANDVVTFSETYLSAAEQILTIKVTGDKDEFYTNNNTTWQTVSAYKKNPVVLDESFTVKFAGTTDDPYDGMSFNASEGRYETVYTGSAIKPEVVITGQDGMLIEGVDYTVKYKNNKTFSKNGKLATVTITGKGHYTGKKVIKFYILKTDLKTAAEKGLLIVPDVVKTQTGKKINPILCYADHILSSKEMSLSINKKVTADTNLDITGKGGFTGTLNGIAVRVVSADDAKASQIKVSLAVDKHVYDGSEQELTCSATAQEGELTVTSGKSDTPLTYGTDYVVRYGNNTAAGKARVTVIGIGEYYGGVSKTFEIEPDKASDIAAELIDTEPVTFTEGGVTPDVFVTLTKPDGSKTVLTEGKDYRVSYRNNTKPGNDASYSVKFCGNYKGHTGITDQKFAVEAASFADASVVLADMIYKKAGKYISAPFVSKDGVRLSSKDYSVKYYDGNTEITKKTKISLDEGAQSKEITVKVTGKRNYKNEELTATYSIVKPGSGQISLSGAKIVALEKNSRGKDIAIGKQEYSGEEIKPALRGIIKNGNTWTELPADSYSITYINNVETGKATVLITGNGVDAVGSKKATFAITAKDINGFDF
ncbi:MAG: leucine-rich repeat protein [Lachnospiraceae bacterium]|nr:leucine-rich repeat protein [Lachnospiraceae bacterium]